MRRLRAAFDKPTILALIGGLSLPFGIGAVVSPGWGIVVFGIECIAAAVLSTTTRR